MIFTFRTTDVQDEACRNAIVGPLVSYNQSKTRRNDFRPLIVALDRGCHRAWLDTFEFQSRGFYERLGYTCFGERSDYPPATASTS
jgi:hypothetical protein